MLLAWSLWGLGLVKTGWVPYGECNQAVAALPLHKAKRKEELRSRVACDSGHKYSTEWSAIGESSEYDIHCTRSLYQASVCLYVPSNGLFSHLSAQGTCTFMWQLPRSRASS